MSMLLGNLIDCVHLIDLFSNERYPWRKTTYNEDESLLVELQNTIQDSLRERFEEKHPSWRTLQIAHVVKFRLNAE